MLYCPKCGATYSEKDGSCPHCGNMQGVTQINADAVDKVNPAANVGHPTEAEINPSVQEWNLTPDTYQKPARQPVSKGFIIGAVIALVAAVALVIVLVIVLGSSFGKKIEETLTSSAAVASSQQSTNADTIEALQAAIEQNPDEPTLYIRLADAYLAEGKHDKALETLQRGYRKTEAPEINERIMAMQS